MKAFLLAAGVGSRLRPITDTTPKCMLAIGGQPLLDIWLDAFGRAGFDEVLVNLHHLPDVARQHLDSGAGPPAVGRVALWTSDLCRASPVPCFSGRPRTGMTAVSSAAPSMRT
jgi:NDP-sugar pyrophosphorylase family protein